ncbi:hypothetical protein [Bacillus pumilus]|uniref:Uncharacterized protein n=1 Tax=Bacillus pumilus TaxID=1408 RepID=A0AAE3WKR3_BACPU|nr:hypothetical protein [Bacillus pumilus]MDF9458035.1 hypothetical protein [Bacillus pumilus]MDF9460613.1 hypothetical protein [Bacillus pumilus]MDR4250742.1 hypothetical protein [Bacillus pumilus]
MRGVTKDVISKGSLKAYVNRKENSVKVVINDEFEIVLEGTTDGIGAKKIIRSGYFELGDVQAFYEDVNTKLIKGELKRLSQKLSDMYENAEKIPGFFMYSKDVERNTEEVAFEITNIKSHGIPE